MSAYPTHLSINARAHPPPAYGPAQEALLNREAFADVVGGGDALPRVSSRRR